MSIIGLRWRSSWQPMFLSSRFRPCCNVDPIPCLSFHLLQSIDLPPEMRYHHSKTTAPMRLSIPCAGLIITPPDSYTLDLFIPLVSHVRLRISQRTPLSRLLLFLLFLYLFLATFCRLSFPVLGFLHPFGRGHPTIGEHRRLKSCFCFCFCLTLPSPRQKRRGRGMDMERSLDFGIWHHNTQTLHTHTHTYTLAY